MKVEIRSVFESEEDIGHDAAAYRVYIDDKCIAEFGDDYHDKGYHKSEGFIDGYFAALKKDSPTTVSYTNEIDENIYS